MLAPPPPRPTSPWKVARRTLLVGGGAGIGLALGWLAWPRREEIDIAAAPGEAIVNSWLKIGHDGRVVVIVPQAEMGQGIHTGLAQVLADELGADWRTVSVEPAPLNPVYANRAALADALDGVPHPFAGIAGWTARHLAERFDLQITGGSTSMRGFEGPMRLAGATARTMLCKAAARRWGSDWRQCDTKDGFVVNGASRVRFGEVAAAAAGETPEPEPKLQPVASIGRAARRLDVPAKTDGSAKFAADVRLPGMVFAAIRHGPLGGDQPPEIVGGLPESGSVTRGAGWIAATGETWWAANRAVKALDLRWPNPPELADSAAIARRLSGALDGMTPPPGTGRLIEARYSVPFVPHAAIEPMTATARIVDGAVEIWAPTQSTRLCTRLVAQALAVEEAAVTVYQTLIGGGFGRKVESDAAVQAALIARDLKRPVQLIWSREEDLGNSYPRPPASARMMARLGPGGAIAAWRTRIAAPNGRSFALRALPAMAPGAHDADPGAIAGAAGVPYAVGDYAAEHVAVPVPVPTGVWRSVSHSYTAFFVESFIDELAHAAGKDPLLFRLGLLGAEPRHATVLRAAAEAAGYQPGMGVACHAAFGSVVGQIVELADGDTPGVRRVSVAIDCGRAINPDLVRQQMEGGVVWGLSAALSGKQTYTAGYAVERNFDAAPLLGLAATPEIEVVILTNPSYPLGGVGEAGVPPTAPALANALAATTGRRARDLPLSLA